MPQSTASALDQHILTHCVGLGPRFLVDAVILHAMHHMMGRGHFRGVLAIDECRGVPLGAHSSVLQRPRMNILTYINPAYEPGPGK